MRVAAALVLAACGSPSVVDIDAPLPIDALGDWSPPMRLVELNSDASDTDPTLSADGLEIVFSSSRSGGMGSSDLYRASRSSITEPFGAPALITELNTPGSDQAAELAADGLTIYLRKMGATSLDIFTSRRPTRSAPFGTLVYEPQLSTADVETNPAISRDNLTFSITRGSGVDRELHVFERDNAGAAWGAPRQLTELSTPGNESGAAFARDGLAVVFHTDRGGTMSDINDLYVATRASRAEPFGAAVPLSNVNASGDDSDATVTADFRYLVFACAGDLCFATR